LVALNFVNNGLDCLRPQENNKKTSAMYRIELYIRSLAFIT